MGCPVAWKCLVACLFFDESQQPTCPQLSQSRRCTQVSPIFRHSSQPFVRGRGLRIDSRCVQTCVVAIDASFPSGGGCQLVGSLELPMIKTRVQSTPLEHVHMSPSLDDLTVVHHQDDVGSEDGREPVRDYQ